jgi:hypothetical protein
MTTKSQKVVTAWKKPCIEDTYTASVDCPIHSWTSRCMYHVCEDSIEMFECMKCCKQKQKQKRKLQKRKLQKRKIVSLQKQCIEDTYTASVDCPIHSWTSHCMYHVCEDSTEMFECMKCCKQKQKQQKGKIVSLQKPCIEDTYTASVDCPIHSWTSRCMYHVCEDSTEMFECMKCCKQKQKRKQ